MNTMLIMDVVIFFLGIYLVYVSLKMKKTSKIDRFVIPEENLNRCKDEAGFAVFLAPKMLLFSVLLTVAGAIMVVDDAIYSIGNWIYVVLSIILIAFGFFYKALTDGKNTFC